MSGIVDHQSILWISTDYSQVNQTNPSQTGFLTDNVIEQAQRSSRHGGQIWNAVVNRADSQVANFKTLQCHFQNLDVVPPKGVQHRLHFLEGKAYRLGWHIHF